MQLKKIYCKVLFFLEGMIVLIVRYAHNKFYLNKKRPIFWLVFNISNNNSPVTRSFAAILSLKGFCYYVRYATLTGSCKYHFVG